jgi:hypothetical protein
MVKPGVRADWPWSAVAAFSIVVPIALICAYMALSRVAIPALKGWSDFVALFVCALAGAVPIFRLRSPRLQKILFTFVYIVLSVILLGMLAFTIDCSLFHDCD